jgi:endonuclease/exonuclease/phosphatase (EEP) superfamily protein YafD
LFSAFFAWQSAKAKGRLPSEKCQSIGFFVFAAVYFRWDIICLKNRRDHIYYDNHLKIKNAFAHRIPLALVASDHLPLVADFSLK